MKVGRIVVLLLIWMMVIGGYPHFAPKSVEGGSALEWTWKYETNSTVKGISITDDAKYIGAYDYANNVYLFESDTGSLVKTWHHSADIRGIKIAKKAEPPLVFVNDDHAVYVYKQDKFYRSFSPNGTITAFDISADGKFLMVTYYYKYADTWKYNVSVYDVESNTSLWNYASPRYNAKGVFLSACYDGKLFVLGVSESGYVRIQLYEKDSPNGPKWESEWLRWKSGYLSRITAMKMSDDGTVILVATNNAVHKFIQTQPNEVWRIDGIRDGVAVSMNYSGSEGFVAAGKQITYMDLSTMNESKRFKWNWTTPDNNTIVSAVMDKDGNYMVVATAKNMWLIYVPVHKPFRSIELSTDFDLVSSLDLSRDDGSRVALGAAYRVTDNPAGVYMFDNPKAIKPQPCKILAISDITTTSMNVTWAASTAPDFEQYELYCDSNLEVITKTPERAEKVYVIKNIDITHKEVTGLQPGTTYFFKLRVICITGLYADSEVTTKMTEVPPPPPDYTPYIVAAVVTIVIVVFLLWYFYLRHKIPEWREKRKKKKGKAVAWHQRPGEYLPPGFE